jgi:hypothetical protein
MAVCIIRAYRKEKRVDRAKSNDKHFPSRQSSARSSSMAKLDNRRRTLHERDRSLASGRSYGSKRSQSGVTKNLKSFGNTSQSNMDLSMDTDLLPRKSNDSFLQFFTTNSQASHIVLKQKFEDRISEKMVKCLLRFDTDYQKFLTGLYEDEGNLRMY